MGGSLAFTRPADASRRHMWRVVIHVADSEWFLQQTACALLHLLFHRKRGAHGGAPDFVLSAFSRAPLLAHYRPPVLFIL